MAAGLKGDTVSLFTSPFALQIQDPIRSSIWVDCAFYNRVAIQVSGTYLFAPASVYVVESDTQNGPFDIVEDPRGTRTLHQSFTGTLSFSCLVQRRFVTVAVNGIQPDLISTPPAGQASAITAVTIQPFVDFTPLQPIVPSKQFAVVSGIAQPLPLSGGPCTLYRLDMHNASSAVAYLQVFDALVANVTLGSTFPTLQFLLPIGTTSIDFTGMGGVPFTTELVCAPTTASEGSSIVATGISLNAEFYQ